MATSIFYSIRPTKFKYPYFLLQRTTPSINFNMSETKLHSVAPKKVESPRSNKKGAAQMLENLLNIKTLSAYDIVSTHKNLARTQPLHLKNNYQLYSQRGITKSILLRYPQLLAVVEAEQKLVEIEKISNNINEVATLLLLPFADLIKLKTELSTKQSRIMTLSSLLQIDTQKACECLVEKPFLNSLSLDKITRNIKLLLKFGVTPDDICNDFWVLRYSSETITRRLSIADEHNIDTKKTWMVRATEETFETYLRRRSDNKSILGNSSLAEYLSERLECSLEMAKYLIIKQPVLQNKSLKKLKELIDVLFSAGFQPQQICRVPKILVHSVETTRKRLQQLEEKGIKIDSLSILTKSQNQFTLFCDALVKGKGKAKTIT